LSLLTCTIVVIVATMGFNFTNGFHDSANAIATSVSTRALTPRVALVMAAFGNLIGSYFFGAKVAATVGGGIIAAPQGQSGLAIVLAAVLGAVVWNLVTWYFGIPSSSSHALFGGLVGAALVAGDQVLWGGIVDKVLIPMVVSPVAGLVLGFLVMLAVLWIFRRGNPNKLNRGFRHAQSASALAMSIGHGMQDGAKSIGIVGLALTVGGYLGANEPIPSWVFLMSAAVLGLGTASGGWRIIRTLGRRVIHLQPPQGFAAETVASSVLFTASAYGLPISTTHTITSAIMGVGTTKRLRAVRWGVAGNIMVAWVLTFPAAGLVAAGCYFLVRPLFG
jgi:inorganic phosphate transporter, PiT family